MPPPSRLTPDSARNHPTVLVGAKLKTLILNNLVGVLWSPHQSSSPLLLLPFLFQSHLPLRHPGSVLLCQDVRNFFSAAAGNVSLHLCIFLYLSEEAHMISISKVVWIIDHTFPHSLLESAADGAGLPHFTNFHSVSGNT